jgi:hypothetical protein
MDFADGIVLLIIVLRVLLTLATKQVVYPMLHVIMKVAFVLHVAHLI